LGIVIERPVFYGHLTLIENLKIIARYRKLDAGRIYEVLEMVEMKDFIKTKMNQSSTGMKQRMGIAAALMHNPQVIILDEPVNGLDPEGIIEVRNVLKTLKSEGKTLIVSSHILSEMEKICDQLIILKNGKAVYSGPLEDLLRNRNNKEIVLNATPIPLVIGLLSYEKIPFRIDNENIYIDIDHRQVPDLLKKLVNKDIRIDYINFHVKTLEDLYISLN
jgi:ABC-2 type transport system ATP-binding protein